MKTDQYVQELERILNTTKNDIGSHVYNWNPEPDSKRIHTCMTLKNVLPVYEQYMWEVRR